MYKRQTAACVTTEPFADAKLTGYEIHAGRTEVRGSAFCILADGTPEGCVQDSVFGTYLHGLFDTGELTEKLTAFLCKRKGIDPAGAELIPMEQYRQQQFDLLADGVRAALDMPAIYAAMGMQKGLSLIHISEPTRRTPISYAVFCLKKKKLTGA